MPYPSQIDEQRILAQARTMIEAEGITQLSLHQLAHALGVKTPSLYRYVNSKVDLLQKLNLDTVQRLFGAMETAVQAAPNEPEARLLALLQAFRAFAHANPHSYTLLFSNLQPSLRPDETWLVQLVLPLQELISAVSGPQNSLAALRGALALVHGFVMLELNQQLRRGGDLNEAFTHSVQAYLRGWQNQ